MSQFNTYNNILNSKVTHQTEPIPGKNMKKNNARGYSFRIDPFKQLERFLILGTTGGTYYVKQRPLTFENAEIVRECLVRDSQKTLDMIFDISTKGRAPSNDPALFALAIACCNPLTLKQALYILESVARTGTHLLHFAAFLDSMRGWGRAIRTAVGEWYTSKEILDLAFQIAKYQQRDGWSHKDVLRLAHPVPLNASQDTIFKYIVGKSEDAPDIGMLEPLRKLKDPSLTEEQVVEIISKNKAIMEIVPSEWKNKPNVQKALLPNLGFTALVRNLGNFSKSGLLVSGAWDVIDFVTQKLGNEVAIKKSKIHPMQAVSAYLTYHQGSGFRGHGEWETVPQIVEALEGLVYKSFENVEPTNKKYYLALDVSGSMDSPISESGQITCAQATAIMAMTIARSEKNYIIKGFSSVLKDLDITANTSIRDAFNITSYQNFGATDCALPMIDALKNNIYVDAFVILTDSETWYGSIHPVQALKQYQNAINKDAKLIVVAMTATGFSIAEPNNPNMLDVVGFDTSTPAVISEFIR